ncbi:hypothetical protein HMPREF1584_00175 [Gardnerella vaginalis JCP8481A]|nr:hypothetical protein HMPREF1584_00175 [Gardnerella vaginalis JCP8481A]
MSTLEKCGIVGNFASNFIVEYIHRVENVNFSVFPLCSGCQNVIVAVTLPHGAG